MIEASITKFDTHDDLEAHASVVVLHPEGQRSNSVLVGFLSTPTT